MPFPACAGGVSRQALSPMPAQCVDATGLTPGEAAMAEPLAVALHATTRAGGHAGQAGSGHGMRADRGAGDLGGTAGRVRPRSWRRTCRISRWPLAAQGGGGPGDQYRCPTRGAGGLHAAGKGHFDVLYECTGVAAALAGGIAALAPAWGNLATGPWRGDMTLPMMAITAKELDLRGSFRFHPEFALGVGLMRQGLVDVRSADHPDCRRWMEAEAGLSTGVGSHTGDEGADRVFFIRAAVAAGIEPTATALPAGG